MPVAENIMRSLNLKINNKEYPLEKDRHTIIGQRERCFAPDIDINHWSVDGKHALIQMNTDNKTAMIIDLSSQEGTFLNGVKLSPLIGVKVEPMAVVRFGRVDGSLVLSAVPAKDQSPCDTSGVILSTPETSSIYRRLGRNVNHSTPSNGSLLIPETQAVAQMSYAEDEDICIPETQAFKMPNVRSFDLSTVMDEENEIQSQLILPPSIDDAQSEASIAVPLVSHEPFRFSPPRAEFDAEEPLEIIEDSGNAASLPNIKDPEVDMSKLDRSGSVTPDLDDMIPLPVNIMPDVIEIDGLEKTQLFVLPEVPQEPILENTQIFVPPTAPAASSSVGKLKRTHVAEKPSQPKRTRTAPDSDDDLPPTQLFVRKEPAKSKPSSQLLGDDVCATPKWSGFVLPSSGVINKYAAEPDGKLKAHMPSVSKRILLEECFSGSDDDDGHGKGATKSKTPEKNQNNRKKKSSKSKAASKPAKSNTPDSAKSHGDGSRRPSRKNDSVHEDEDIKKDEGIGRRIKRRKSVATRINYAEDEEDVSPPRTKKLNARRESLVGHSGHRRKDSSDKVQSSVNKTGGSSNANTSDRNEDLSTDCEDQDSNRTNSQTSNISTSVTNRYGHKKRTIVFTGFASDAIKKYKGIAHFGLQVINDIKKADILVCKSLSRTFKLLVAVARGIPVVSSEYLDQVLAEQSSILDYQPFLVRDRQAESKYKFNLKDTLAASSSGKLFDGYTFIITKSTQPPPSELKDMISLSGGKVVKQASERNHKKGYLFLLTDPADRALWAGYSKNHPTIKFADSDALMNSILQQKVILQQSSLELN